MLLGFWTTAELGWGTNIKQVRVQQTRGMEKRQISIYYEKTSSTVKLKWNVYILSNNSTSQEIQSQVKFGIIITA